MKPLKINNSSEIKQILDKVKDISIAEEMGILSYVYALENNNLDLKEELKNKNNDIELDVLKALNSDLDDDINMEEINK